MTIEKSTTAEKDKRLYIFPDAQHVPRLGNSRARNNDDSSIGRCKTGRIIPNICSRANTCSAIPRRMLSITLRDGSRSGSCGRYLTWMPFFTHMLPSNSLSTYVSPKQISSDEHSKSKSGRLIRLGMSIHRQPCNRRCVPLGQADGGMRQTRQTHPVPKIDIVNPQSWKRKGSKYELNTMITKGLISSYSVTALS